MWDWDILTALLIPALLSLFLVGVGAGVAWDEYHHRKK